MQIQNALKTHEQVAREMGGGDWDENVEQLADEMTKLTEAGVVPADSDVDEGDGDNAGE